MGRVCPWWLGYLLASPVRKLIHDPVKILRPYLKTGMVAVDIGSGMGYFSIPMTKLVGREGKIICVDLQAKMLSSLRKRALNAGVLESMVIRQATPDSLQLGDIAGTADFVLTFAVVHEVPDQARLFSEICAVLKPGGQLLISEPGGHVTEQQFAATELIAEANGFEAVATPDIRRTYSALLRKPRGRPQL
jgi:ubiquinone/menaquinone biosynthesis C-methylase UbiE